MNAAMRIGERGLNHIVNFPEETGSRRSSWAKLGEPSDLGVAEPLESGSATSLLCKIEERRRAAEERDALQEKMRELQKLASLGVAAGGLAHDFVNLMTGVRGYSEFALTQEGGSGMARVAIEKIMAIADRAAEMCKQVLSSAATSSTRFLHADVSQLVEETADMVKWRVSKSAKVELNLSRDLPLIVGNPSQLRQVFMNLFINASDALNGATGTVRVETGTMRATAEYLRSTIAAPRIEEGEFVFVEVADTGCGMSADTVAQIFQPFFTTKATGRGLGLASVLDTARAHGGALHVSSEVGKGTTFRLLFPVALRPVAAEDAIQQEGSL